MKKGLVLIAIVIVVFIGGVYIFIPNVITLNSSIAINTSQKGLQRMLLDKKSIAKWWTGENSQGLFYVNGYTYQIHDNGMSLLPIIIENKKTSINSSLFIIPLQDDSAKLEWVGKTISSYNPITRFNSYLNARKLNNDMGSILQHMKQHYSLPENIYGCDIRREQVVDDKLISTSGKCNGFPTTEFIYSLIAKLKNYAEEKSTKITGYPMLNIEPFDSTNYLVKVALPLENLLPGNGDILQKRMLKDGNILVAKTEGGYAKTSEVFNQIKNYANDYKMSSPAIPFYSLITDRTKETDSSKWVTKIYYPVR